EPLHSAVRRGASRRRVPARGRHPRSASQRQRLPSHRRARLPGRRRGRLRFAVRHPAPGAAHRRPGAGHHGHPARARQELAPGRGDHRQRAGPGAGAGPGGFRQPAGVVPRRAAEAGNRGRGARRPRPARLHQPHHRPDLAAGQRAARADRGPRQGGKDHGAAGHHARRAHQLSRCGADGAAGGRAAGRSHRNADAGHRRGDRQLVRLPGRAPRGGRRDGAGARAAPGGKRPRRGDRARLADAPGARLQHQRARHGAHAFRRHRQRRAGKAQALLRQRAQGAGRHRQPHHHRHGAHRHGEPRRRGDLRGVQGHGQQRNRAGPYAGRQAHLPGHRHREERHPPRRDAVSAGAPGQDLSASARAALAEPRRRDQPADQADERHAQQRRASRPPAL
ncbi:MAG: Transcription termination factor Rho, partial [uncultured Gemmatimonadetes bacterium]